MGIDKLSLILIEDNSVNVAINAPNMIMLVSMLNLNKDPITQQVRKHAIEPDKVFRPILRKG